MAVLVGRPRILGTEICPVHKTLGRYRLHSRRRAKLRNVRLAKHYTFVHNDRSVREHYIRNPKRRFRKSIGNKILGVVDGYSYSFRKYAERVKMLPLDEYDSRRWKIECIKHLQNVIIPSKLTLRAFLLHECLSLLAGEPTPEDIRKEFEKLKITKSPAGDPFLDQLKYIYQKYDLPDRLKWNKIRNQKLSRSYNYPQRTLPDPSDLSSVPAMQS